MIRKIASLLEEWRSKQKHKPLILTGARQVGKTWLMKELGANHFENFVYINFEKDGAYVRLFEADLNVDRVIHTIGVMTNHEIVDGKTLVIFDEIQEAPKALTSLKYFQEDRPNLHVIAAGSLLGVTLESGSFPVGKVEFLQVRPMGFEEFLMATDRSNLYRLLQSEDFAVISNFKEQFIFALKQYFLVGGMPEVVQSFADNTNNFSKIKEIQESILMAYLNDFAKHAPAQIIPKINMIWNSLVGQLAKENKKFIYGLLKSGARARDYEQAIDWLVNYGLIHKVYAINKVAQPLQAYNDLKAFKLFALDLGLLSSMAQIPVQLILESDTLFQEFKGAITEQYVLQELLLNRDFKMHYWSNENGTAEVDFIFEKKGTIYPLEVKSAENLQAKSLRVFNEKHPEIHCYRTSLSDYRAQDWLTNLPLYCIGRL